MKDHCPDCGASIQECTSKPGDTYFKCPKCGWWATWIDWVDEFDRDPDKYNYQRYMDLAELEATNPNQ